MMKKRSQSSARRFQALVAELLQLSGNSSESTVKTALRAKGTGFVEWYEARQRAIVEAEAQAGTAQKPAGTRSPSRSTANSDPPGRSAIRRRAPSRRVKLDP
jgi:hypothetical protein